MGNCSFGDWRFGKQAEGWVQLPSSALAAHDTFKRHKGDQMNVVSIEKIAFQVADSALIVGAFIGQLTVRHGERLGAILQDQARQDLRLTRDRLMFDGYTLMHEPEALAQDFRNTAYDALAYVFQALMLLPDFYYFMVEVLDHEIPLSLEAELKLVNVVRPPQLLLTAPTIAGFLPPASEVEGQPEFRSTLKVAEVVPVEVETVRVTGMPAASVPSTTAETVELPVGWNLDKRGRKLHGSALQARMKKYNLVSA
jgi:hypothetical protein